MINMTPESLLAYMRKHNYEADIQADTQQVYTILKISEREYPLFLRVFDDGHLLQLLAFIPSQLEKNIIPDMARLLHILNKELDVPGFGMDEMAGVVFYRLMLPTPKKKIDGELLVAFLKTIEQVCTMFAAPIEAVGQGHMTLDEILKKAEEMQPE
jgi:hypothetical protein